MAWYLGFLLLLLIPAASTTAFGDVVNFSTDKDIYHKDDHLHISGNVFF